MVVVDTIEGKLLGREKLILIEIGRDEIDSASAFVDYMHEVYGFSKSSVWYSLNRLKGKGMLDFASRDAPGKRLGLTGTGMAALPSVFQERKEIMQVFGGGAMVVGRAA